MFTISEFSSNIYFIKPNRAITLNELKQVPDLVKLINNKNFELKPHEHGIWILHLLDSDVPHAKPLLT